MQDRRQGNKGTKRARKKDLDMTSPKFSLRQFISLVEEIAASDAAIPASYISLLELSITQRKATAAFYAPDAEVSACNKSHMFAIQSYSQALFILKEAQKKRAGSDADLASSLRTALTLNVTFSEDSLFSLSEAIHQLVVVLEEEVSSASMSSGFSQNEWLCDNPNITANFGRKHRKPNLFALEEYELVPDDYFEPKSQSTKVKLTEENMFEALRCFLLDLNDMRKYCRKVWNSVVPVGNNSHIAASFVTNKAIQLVKQLEYSLLVEFPALKDIRYSFEHLVVDVASQMPLRATNEDLYHYRDQIMFYAWSNLEEFSLILGQFQMPVLRSNHFGEFDPLADRRSMSPREKQKEDRAIMGNHWIDLLLATSMSGIITFNDELFAFMGYHGLAHDMETFRQEGSDRRVTWALIFSCQIHADSVQARRKYLDYDLNVMRSLGQNIQEEYSAFLEDGFRSGPVKDVATQSVINHSAAEIHNWLQADIVWRFKTMAGYDEFDGQPTRKDALWLQNPCLTANAISEATLNFFFLGAAVVGTEGFIASTLHLWNMLRKTGHLTGPLNSTAVVGQQTQLTKDSVLLFDHLMEVFGESVFFGEPPQSNFFRPFNLMAGISAGEFASGKRTARKTTTEYFVKMRSTVRSTGAHGIEDMCKSWKMHFVDNYFTKPDSGAGFQTRISQTRGKHPLEATLDIVNSELGQTAALPSQGASRGPLLNLNMFKIHGLCMDILDELNTILRPYTDFFTESLDSSPDASSYLPGWIARTESLPGNNGLPDRMMLMTAAEVFKKVAGNKELGMFLIRGELQDPEMDKNTENSSRSDLSAVFPSEFLKLLRKKRDSRR